MDIIYKKATIDDAFGICYVSAHSWKETYKGLLPDEVLNLLSKDKDEMMVKI